MIYLGPVFFGLLYTGFSGFILAYADAVLLFPHVQLVELIIITTYRTGVGMLLYTDIFLLP